MGGRVGRNRIAGMVAVAVAVAMAAVAGVLVAPTAGATTSQLPAVDRAKIRGDLAQRLDHEPMAQQRVIVVGRHGSTTGALAALSDRVGGRAYTLFPAFTARVDRAHVEAVAASADVASIQLDGVVHATMDTARYWYGADSARQAGYAGHLGDASHRTNVAVIDTGIDDSNPELANGKVVAFENCVGGSCLASSPFDNNGHGTHVSGIVAGAGVDAALRGVAPSAGLVGMKVLDGSGNGSDTDIINAIQRVVAQKDAWHVGVISMSLGGLCGASGTPPCDGSDALSQAVDAAWAASVVTVVAAGNDGPGIGTVGIPATAHHVISVGAMSDVTPGPSGFSDTPDAGFYLAPWSSRGPTSDGRVKPEISAPGVAIRSTCSHDAPGPPGDGCPNSSTQSIVLSGTSMATPFVAGTVALMLAANAALSPDEVLGELQSTAVPWVGDDDPGPAVISNEAGAGRLDVAAAVSLASSTTISGPKVPPHTHVRSTLVNQGDTATYPVTMPSGGSCPLAVTLNAPGETDTTPVLSLALKQGSNNVPTSGTGGRADVMTKQLAPGSYNIVVTRGAGSGSGVFDLDISGPSPDSDTCTVLTAFSAVDAGANPAPAKPGFTNGDLRVGFSAAGSGTAPAAWAVTVDDPTPPTSGGPGWNTMAATADTLSGADGSHTLYPWLKDAAGDVTSATQAFAHRITVTLDTTAPTGVSVTGPSGRIPARASYPVSWTTSTSGPGDQAVVAYVAGSVVTLASGVAPTGAITAKAPDTEASAATVRVTVTDQAGNQATGSSSPFQVTGLGGYWADSYGGVHTFGSAPGVGEANRFGIALGRAFAGLPTLDGGWLLDGYGGIHPVGTAPALPGGGPYWSGWDIARDLAVPAGAAGGYVLDGYGGVHTFGAVPAVTGAPYFGFDIARRLVLVPGGGGYVLDGYGGVHPFATGGVNPPAISGGPYFGFDIARGLVVQPGPASTLRAYLLDGYGGIHPLLIAGSPAPAGAAGNPYWSGWDIVRGITLFPDGSGGYVLDGYGGVHPWAAGAAALPPSLPSTGYGRTARALAAR